MKNFIKNVFQYLVLLVLFAVFAGCQEQIAKDIGGGAWPPRQFSIGGTQAAPRTLTACEQRTTGGPYPIVNVERISAVGSYARSHGK